MRAILVALLLTATAVPALAHTGHSQGSGLHMTDLVITFDALTQAQRYTFFLNNSKSAPTGLLTASITTELGPRFSSAPGLAGTNDALGRPSEGTVSVLVPLTLSLDSCIIVSASGSGHQGFSNQECGQLAGVTEFPLVLPDVPAAPEPEAPEVPEAPQVPEEVPPLPDGVPPTLP